MTKRAALCLIGVTAAATAAADMTPTGQSRSVEVTSETTGALWLPGQTPNFPDYDPPSYSQSAASTDMQSAADFDSFDQTVSVGAPGVPTVPTAGTSTASMTSSISGTQLAASASLSSASDAYVLSQATLDLINMFLPPGTYWLGFGYDHNDGAARYAVDFDVAAETPFTLTGQVTMQAADPWAPWVGSHFGSALVRLSGPGGVIHETSWDQVFDACDFFSACGPADFDIDEAGTLAPGSYTLEAEMSASAWGGCGDVPDVPPCWLPTNSGSFDVTLSIGDGSGCPPSPAAGCIGTGTARLVVKEGAIGKEKMRAIFKRFASDVTQADLGDPVGGDSRWDVCVYDAADTLVAELSVDRAGQDCGTPPRPCWRPVGTSGYAYKDRDASASGVQVLLGKGGLAPGGLLKVKAGNNAGKGQTSMPIGIAGRLDGATQVRVQVATGDAACFEASLATVTRADGEVLKAKAR